jgi:hypothetical protein
MVKAFEALVAALPVSVLHDWRFITTGAVLHEIQTNCRQVENVGSVNNLFEVLSESRAVAIPSALGRGFKTKILDAIACGAWVLLPSKLYQRLPDPVRPFCIVLSDKSSALYEAIRELQQREWPKQDANETLRSLAFAAMDSSLK